MEVSRSRCYLLIPSQSITVSGVCLFDSSHSGEARRNKNETVWILTRFSRKLLDCQFCKLRFGINCLLRMCSDMHVLIVFSEFFVIIKPSIIVTTSSLKIWETWQLGTTNVIEGKHICVGSFGKNSQFLLDRNKIMLCIIENKLLHLIAYTMACNIYKQKVATSAYSIVWENSLGFSEDVLEHFDCLVGVCFYVCFWNSQSLCYLFCLFCI